MNLETGSLVNHIYSAPRMPTPQVGCGCVYTFAPVRRDKNKGQIREQGLTGGQGILIGVRDQYYDYSF